MTTTTDTLTILKLLVKGRPPAFVAQAVEQNETFIEMLAKQHGWPDRQKLADAIAVLEIDGATPIPEREPEPIPSNLTTPVVRRGPSPPPPPAPPTAAAPTTGPTVDELLRFCRESKLKRVQNLGPKLTEIVDRIHDAQRAEQEAIEAKAKRNEELIAAQAEVDRLSKALAKARAKVVAAGGQGGARGGPRTCEPCGIDFPNGQALAGHKRHHHAPTPSSQESTA